MLNIAIISPPFTDKRLFPSQWIKKKTLKIWPWTLELRPSILLDIYCKIISLDAAMKMVKVSHSIVTVGAVGARGPLYLLEHSYPSLLTVSSFPESKQVPIYCWVDRESFPVTRWPNTGLNHDRLYHKLAALTT